jgi:hypothetical protein
MAWVAHGAPEGSNSGTVFCGRGGTRCGAFVLGSGSRGAGHVVGWRLSVVASGAGASGVGAAGVAVAAVARGAWSLSVGVGGVQAGGAGGCATHDGVGGELDRLGTGLWALGAWVEIGGGLVAGGGVDGGGAVERELGMRRGGGL